MCPGLDAEPVFMVKLAATFHRLEKGFHETRSFFPQVLGMLLAILTLQCARLAWQLPSP